MTNGGAATAVLTPCQNSHEFGERRVNLSEDFVKVGRSVARLKPLDDNAIFDCKVLSRTHAVLWYEDGSFFLKDTKSSNGTFVNNERLSKGAEESAPKEIYSGDIVQFGVDIIENAKKVTHGCIIAIVRLLHPNGQEAVNNTRLSSTESLAAEVSSVGGGRASAGGGVVQPQALNGHLISPAELFQLHQYIKEAAHSSSTESLAAEVSSVGGGRASAGGGVVQPQALNGHLISPAELFQLHQYIKEAAHRESALESKLETLQGLVASTQEASESNWKALIDEDRLLSRIEMLEGQLALYSKAATEDKLRDEVIHLQNEKAAYETAAKESLRRALEEKVEAVNKMSDVERALETTEEEVARLRDACSSAEVELDAVREHHARALKRQGELEDELRAARAAALETSQLASAAAAAPGPSVAALEEELSQTQAQLSLHSQRAAEVEAQLASSDRQLHSVLETAVRDLQGQLTASVGQTESSEALVGQLQAFATNLEAQLRSALAAEAGGKRSEAEELALQELGLLKDELVAVERERKASLGEAEKYEKACALAEATAAKLQAELAAKTQALEEERHFRASAPAATTSQDSSSDHDADAPRSAKDQEERDAFHRQAAKNEAEWARLRDECGRLRDAMEAAEDAGKRETARLKKENAALNDALRQLKAQASSPRGKAAPLDASAEAEALRSDLLAARRDASDVRSRAVAAESLAEGLRLRLSEATGEEAAPPALGLVSWRALIGLALALFLYYFPLSLLFASSEPEELAE